MDFQTIDASRVSTLSGRHVRIIDRLATLLIRRQFIVQPA